MQQWHCCRLITAKLKNPADFHFTKTAAVSTTKYWGSMLQSNWKRLFVVGRVVPEPNVIPTSGFPYIGPMSTIYKQSKTWSSSWIKVVGISPRIILPKIVSPPGLAARALAISSIFCLAWKCLSVWKSGSRLKLLSRWSCPSHQVLETARFQVSFEDRRGPGSTSRPLFVLEVAEQAR